MNSKVKIIIGIAIFAVLIIGVTLSYNFLKGLPGNDSKNIATQELTKTTGDDDSKAGDSNADDSGKGDSGSGDSDETDSNPEGSGGTAKAPNFSVTDSNGKKVKLSDFAGQPVVINFWASWCPPCKNELPSFDKAYKKYGDKIRFMMVDLTDGDMETREKGREYVRANGFSFPLFFDESEEAVNAYAIRSIPMTVFVDAAGNIVNSYVGEIDENTLNENLEMLLK